MIEMIGITYGHWDTDGFIEGAPLGTVEVDGLPLGRELGMWRRRAAPILTGFC